MSKISATPTKLRNSTRGARVAALSALCNTLGVTPVAVAVESVLFSDRAHAQRLASRLGWKVVDGGRHPGDGGPLWEARRTEVRDKKINLPSADELDSGGWSESSGFRCALYLIPALVALATTVGACGGDKTLHEMEFVRTVTERISRMRDAAWRECAIYREALLAIAAGASPAELEDLREDGRIRRGLELAQTGRCWGSHEPGPR